jgi:hypothetical protein
VALAGSLTCSPTLRKSVQNFPVSLLLAGGALAGEVSTGAGTLTPPEAGVPEPLELLELLELQPASITHAPATTLMTKAARLGAGMCCPLEVGTGRKGMKGPGGPE